MPSMLLEAGTRLGPYEIVSRLGAGGMGVVYRATHGTLQRDVAIKVLPPDFAADPERRRRFEHEARAASALNHPAFVTIHDIDVVEDTRYIAMELVEGRTLREHLRDGPLPIAAAVAIGVQIAEGLAAAHDAGIVHRDLKPENVMIAPGGRVKILDFGLAKHAAAAPDRETATIGRVTLSGVVLGTMPYISPEQADGRPVGRQADQFALGVMFYEMLCGERPFKGGSVAMLVIAIIRDVPKPPRALRAGIPKDLERIVQRCLEKEASRRYPSTSELSDALRACAERGRRRSTLPLSRAALAAGLLLIFAAGTLGAWLWLRAL